VTIMRMFKGVSEKERLERISSDKAPEKIEIM
jgi:hypothetical protein